jgi:hypothetical protein
MDLVGRLFAVADDTNSSPYGESASCRSFKGSAIFERDSIVSESRRCDEKV